MAGTYNGPDFQEGFDVSTGTYHDSGDRNRAEAKARESQRQQAQQNIDRASNGGRNTVVSVDGKRILHQGTAPLVAAPKVNTQPTGRVRSPSPKGGTGGDMLAPLPKPGALVPYGQALGLGGLAGAAGGSLGARWGWGSLNQGRGPAGPVQPWNNAVTAGWGLVAGTQTMPPGARPGNIPQVQTQFQLLQNTGTQVQVNPLQPNSYLANYKSTLMPSTQRMPTPQPQGGTYTIKAGDTLSSIAAQLGTSVAQLKASNPNIQNANKIYAGDQINFGSNVSGYATGVADTNSALGAIGSATDPEGYFAAIRSAESGGNDNAKNPKSSASGRYQFTKSTWKDLIRQNPDAGLTEDGRFDVDQQEIAIRLFTAQNDTILSNAGIETTNANRYAAHFLGAGGAKTVLRASNDTMMSDLVTDEVLAANPFLNNMDVGEFKNWTKRKTG